MIDTYRERYDIHADRSALGSEPTDLEQAAERQRAIDYTRELVRAIDHAEPDRTRGRDQTERDLGRRPSRTASATPRCSSTSLGHGCGAPMTLADLPPTVSVEKAGEILGISRRSAYRAAARGELPILRLGRRLLVPTPRLLGLLGAAESDGGVGAVPEPDASMETEVR